MPTAEYFTDLVRREGRRLQGQECVDFIEFAHRNAKERLKANPMGEHVRWCGGCDYCWTPEIAEAEAWERGI